MADLAMLGTVVGMLAVKGAAVLALVYVGARLAIRHERRLSG